VITDTPQERPRGRRRGAQNTPIETHALCVFLVKRMKNEGTQNSNGEKTKRQRKRKKSQMKKRPAVQARHNIQI
jgi:hypothetical protein